MKDSRDIICGYGIVPWAEACTPHHAPSEMPGWVLPGGQRTNDRERAQRVAEAIHLVLVVQRRGY